ncbi:hypothetical protein C2G38_1521542 [Gigaspora rosea]|uniref:Uncharacterized protein n=1 Tax=Gigaspora rosea TaxID=44941 RepID=A0A397V1E6_9GLOM|nr:hypothetical protein C2G38_1521542 [Gigaspora rosea]
MNICINYNIDRNSSEIGVEKNEHKVSSGIGVEKDEHSIENSNGIIALGNCYKGEIGVEKDYFFQVLRITVSDFRAFVVGLMVSVFVMVSSLVVVCGVCLSSLGFVVSDFVTGFVMKSFLVSVFRR